MKKHRPKTKLHFLSGLGGVSPCGAPVEGLETRWLFAAGLTGQYYNDTTLTKLDVTRTDANVNFNWGTSAPATGVPADNFSVRWLGQVESTSSKSYTFSVVTEGGVRLYVNNVLVINHWSTASRDTTYTSSAVSLTGGKEYDIRLESYFATNAADIALRWQALGVNTVVIPTANLVTTYLDTTAPSVPAGLAASGTTATGTSLSWTASTDDVGVASYDVFRNNVQIASTTTASYTDSGLSPNTNYSYKVDARDAAGNVSSAGNTLSVKTTADTTAPSQPTALNVTSTTMSTITFSWTASTDNVGVTAYNIYSGSTSLGSSTTTSYTATGLSPSTSYSFTVKAVDAAGNSSSASIPLVASTAKDTQAPNAPTGLSVSNLTYNSLTLSWSLATDNVGTVAYDVYRNGGYLGTTSNLSWPDSGVQSSTSYSYTVDAKEAAGNISQPSAPFVVMTPPPSDTQPPTTPTGLIQTGATDTSVTFSWNASSDLVGVSLYEIYLGPTEIGTSPTTSYTVSGLTPQTTYSFTVTASDAAGNVSSPSIGGFSATTTRDTTVPSAPTGLTASNITSNSLTLSWSAASDDVGVASYAVYCNGSFLASTLGLSLPVAGLSSSTPYSFVVYAYDAAGNQSLPSQAFQPPVAPTELMQTGASDTTATLSWDAVTDSAGISGYEIFLGQGLSQVEVGTSTTASFTATGLAPSTSYTFTIAAIDDAGNVSLVSDPVVAQTVADTVAPNAPQGLAISNLASGGLTLSWSADSDDVGVTSYDVYNAGSYVGSTSGLSMAISGLQSGITYSLTVDADDAAGNTSLPSTPLSVTTVPSAPTGLSEGSATMTTISLTWTAPSDDQGITGYEIYRNGLAVGSSPTSAYTDSGLVTGTSYNYTITATDSAGNTSVQSSPYSAMTAPDTQAPSIPLGLKVVSSTSNTISLGWSAASDNVAVTGYDIYRNGVQVGTSTTTSYTDTNLSAQTTNMYTVDAYDAAGNKSQVSTSVTGSTTAAFNTWYADSTGKTPGSTTTIGAAYAKANPGDFVVVEPGTYKESLNLTRSGTAAAPITIEAATAGTAILDGGNSLNTAIYGTATYIDLVGLTVQHYKGTSYQNEEAAVRTATGWVLNNDIVQLNSGTGIGVFGNGISLTGVIAQNNGVNGIGGSAATNVTLTNCTSQGNNTGVYFTNHDPTDEGGGGKWANCNGLTFINYHGDNNLGPGVWFDWENSNITLTNCEASGNHGGGPTNAPDWVGAPVMIEANYGPVNVTNFTGAYSNSGPFSIFETPNVSVTQSTLLSGLSFRTLNRGVAALVDNNDVVTHNTILYVDLNGSAPTNLTLDYNNYQAETGYAFFYWANNSSYTTLAALQAATKFELHGTLTYVVYP